MIVLNWNGWTDTIACVESLLRLQNDSVSIIICDNASTDDSVARIINWASNRLVHCNAYRHATGLDDYVFDFVNPDQIGPVGPDFTPPLGLHRLILVQTGANRGYAAGNNVGLQIAGFNSFDYLWIVNNDTEVDSHALTHLIARTKEDSSVGICGSTLIYAERRDLVQAYGGSRFDKVKGRGVTIGEFRRREDPIDRAAVERMLSCINGASTLVTARFLNEVGPMTEDYFLYWEELDWCARAGGRFKLGYAPDSIVYHKVGSSIGTNDFGESSLLSTYYITRNRFKFCFRFSKASIPFVFVDVVRQITRAAIRKKWARARVLSRALCGLPLR